MNNELLTQKISDSVPSLKTYIKSQFSNDILNRIPPEDIAQEVVLRAISTLDQFDYRGDEALWSWLCVVSKRVVCDVIRKKSETVVDRLSTLLMRDSSGHHENKLMDQEQIQIIKDEIFRLKTQYRLVIQLRYFHDKNYQEIGKIINVTASAARGLRRNATKKLVRQLKDHSIFESKFSILRARTKSSKR